MTTGKALTVKKDELQVSESVTGELETTASAAREMAEVQAAVILARKFPRDEQRAFSKLIASCGRASFAEDATYSFPRGGSTVSGPSVNIAREAARLWGNVRFGLDIIRDDEETRGIRAWAWDVESNTKVAYADEFKKLIQRKDKQTGQTRWITPDERDLRELTNRRGAICLRNCLLQLIPKDFIEDALGECDKTLRGQAKQDRPTILKKITASFADLGVSTAMLDKYLGHPLAEATEDEIVRLRGIFKALTDDYAKKEEYFGNGHPKTEEGSLKMDDLKAGAEAEHRGHDIRQPEPPPQGKVDPAAGILADIAAISTRGGITEMDLQINKRIKAAGIKDADAINRISMALNQRKKEILDVQA